MDELVEGGYVKGVAVIDAWGGDRIVKCTSPSTTMRGVEFLHENSTMRKAANFLKETKSMPPLI